MNHPDIDVEKITRRLEDARAMLIDQGFESKEGRATVTHAQASVGRLSCKEALHGPAMAEEDRRQLAIRHIDAALARLDQQEFGSCPACGEWIAIKRLEWDPTVLKCTNCAD